MNVRELGMAFAVAILVSACASQPTGEQEVARSDTSAASADAVAVEKEAAVDPEDQVICKKVVKTGSRFSETICAPRRAWDKSADRGEESTEELQRKPVWRDD